LYNHWVRGNFGGNPQILKSVASASKGMVPSKGGDGDRHDDDDGDRTKKCNKKGTAVSLPVKLDDTVASPVHVETKAGTARTTMTRKKRRKEIYSVKLPTFESIELASRLSAFDSFLFLVNDQQQQVTDSSTTSMTCGQVSDVATIVTKNGESEEHDQRRAENNVQDKNATIITKKNEDTLKTKTRLFIDSLIQQNKDTHHLPTVLITPGMERVIDEKERQKKQKRLIPLEERTVRLIPGSIEEKKVLMDRLSVFDDYLFLLSQNS
jgi:hypothetical protein